MIRDSLRWPTNGGARSHDAKRVRGSGMCTTPRAGPCRSMCTTVVQIRADQPESLAT